MIFMQAFVFLVVLSTCVASKPFAMLKAIDDIPKRARVVKESLGLKTKDFKDDELFHQAAVAIHSINFYIDKFENAEAEFLKNNKSHQIQTDGRIMSILKDLDELLDDIEGTLLTANQEIEKLQLPILPKPGHAVEETPIPESVELPDLPEFFRLVA